MEPAGVAFLVVRGDRERLRRLVRAAGVAAAIGPEERGWTPVGLWTYDDYSGLPSTLTGPAGTVVLGMRTDPDGATLRVRAWSDGGEQAELADSPDGAGVARLASAVGNPEVAGLLGRLLGLPEAVLEDAAHLRYVVVARGDPHTAELAVAAQGGGWAAESEGWSLLAPDGPRRTSLDLALRLSRLGERKDRALLLWRDESCGYAVARRGRWRDSHAWRPQWEFVDGTDGRSFSSGPEGDATELAAAAGRPDVEVPLRALIRRRDDVETVLRELTELLGLPSAVPVLLKGGAEVGTLPTTRRIQRKSVTAAFRTAVAEDMTRPPRNAARTRALFVIAVLAGLACTAMVVFEVVTLATGHEVNSATVAAAVRFTILAALLAGIAVWLRRRLR